VAVATVGCRVNQVESQEILAALEAQGFAPAAEGPAEVVIVNTCAVTARAEVSDRQAVRQAIRRHPGARIVVTGCWAQTNPAAVARLGGVHLVVGNADKGRLGPLVAALLGRPQPSAAEPVSGLTAPDPRPEARSRAFVKVQDGCQHRCAFCIVPHARGPSRSRPPELVVAQVERLVAAGYPEVTLTGVDLGYYGRDLCPPTSLAALLRRVVEVRGLHWVRLSSVLPAYFTPELLEVVTGSPRVAAHVHIPLQTASDRLLRRMRRPYTVGLFCRLVDELLRRRPGLALGTDLIAGFPGETEADFAATRALVDAVPFAYLHVFPYSDRPGTEAARLPDHVPAPVIAARARMLRAQDRAKRGAFRRAHVGRVEEVYVLERRDRLTGHLVGLTSTYVEVVVPGPDTLMRRIVRVRITAAGAQRAHGELVEDAAR
jgi:threonylcarbamoyladenosine tRNA methylthiotransferase MtaB